VAYSSADTGHSLWSLLAVYPNIKTNKTTTGTLQVAPYLSPYRADLSYVSGYKDAKRLTLEQWNTSRLNIFVQGNDILTGEMQEFAYLDMANYNSASYTAIAPEIEIRPSVAKKLVALAYLKVPSEVTTVNDIIPFPETMFDFITEQALRFISHKQGDGTSLWIVTNAEINQLAALFS